MGKRKKCKNKKKNRKKTSFTKAYKNNKILEKKAINKLADVDIQEIIDLEIDKLRPIQIENINTNMKVDSINKGLESNKSDSFTKYLLSGACGALMAIGFFILIAFYYPGFRFCSYYVSEDPSQLTQLLSYNLSANDSLNIVKKITEESASRNDLIKDLFDQGMIISSESFVSNLSSYYNALITVLAALLVILNLFGFLAWRSNASEALEQEKRKLSYEIDNIDKRLESNLEELIKNNQTIKEKLESYFQRLIDQGNHLEEQEWEKLRLLLKKYKYKKNDELVEVKTECNDNDNDGSIEEA